MIRVLSDEVIKAGRCDSFKCLGDLSNSSIHFRIPFV